MRDVNCTRGAHQCGDFAFGVITLDRRIENGTHDVVGNGRESLLLDFWRVVCKQLLARTHVFKRRRFARNWLRGGQLLAGYRRGRHRYFVYGPDRLPCFPVEHIGISLLRCLRHDGGGALTCFNV